MDPQSLLDFDSPAMSWCGPSGRTSTASPRPRSWRADAKGCTVQLVLDCFNAVPRWLPNAMNFPHEWAAENDIMFKGPNSTFAPNMDRRVLWGSYAAIAAERSLDAVWYLYHEDEAKYKRLQATKRAVDPNNILTPNEFAIRAV